MYTEAQTKTLEAAKAILAGNLNTNDYFNNPQSVKLFCQLQFAELEREAFGVLFLSSQNQLISFQHMFYGTIDSASVYPREVAKEALLQNAASVILAHNHPSGVAEASQADKAITERLVAALGLLDIKVLDHIIVTHTTTYSFAEQGLL